MSANLDPNQSAAPSGTQAFLPGGLHSYGFKEQKTVHLAKMGVTGTYMLWGVMPLYWSMLPPMPAMETVLHRTLWTTICTLLLVIYKKQFYATIMLLRDKLNMMAVLGCSLLMLSNNLIYIWAVTNNQVVEAGLGYFLTPLFQMGFGIAMFKERTTFLQKCAILLALGAVGVQIIILGKIPFVAVGIAFTFAAYTAIKKAASFGTSAGLFWETALITPLAAAAIVWLELSGNGMFFSSFKVIVLLICSGPLTTFPLLWFAFGARNLSLVLVGLLQYITPTLTLLLGIFWFKEEVSGGQYISFALIGCSLLMYTFESVRDFHLADRMARLHRLHKLQKMRKHRHCQHH